MAENIVSIVVKATDDTAAGFGASKDSAAASADEIAAAQDRVTAAENKLRDAQISQTDAQLKLEELQQSGVASADELAAAQDKVAQASLRAVDAQIRLGDADEVLAAKESLAGDAGVEQAEKVSLTSRAAGLGGAALANFGMIGSLALAGVGYESIKMAESFQQATERLVTQAGVPQKELAGLRSGVLNLAGAVGFSPDSLAESLYHVASNMASLGATAPEMLNAVKIAAEGAKVGGANLEDVTNSLTAAIASGIPGVQNYSQAMGALNAIVGAGDMKMQDLAEAMGSGVMAVVKGYGLSLKDVGAALDVFGDNNIRGAHAATDLRMAVQALAVPAAAGKAQLASMGLSMTSLADTMRQHGLLAALEELQARFKATGVTAAEQGQVITEIFGKKAGVGLAVLMDQMDRLKSKYPDITAGADNFGKAWAATQQTTKQKLDELRGTFEALGTSIGTKLLPAISAFAGFLDRNRAVLSALAPIILAIVAAMTAWAGIMKVVDILSDLNPWVLAVMAVIAVVVLLVEHWKTVEAVAKTVWHAVEDAVDVAREGIITAGHAISDAVDAVRETFVRMGHDVEAAVDAVVGFVRDHWKLLILFISLPLGLIIDALVTHWNAVKHGFEDAWNFVYGDVIKPVIGFISTLISGFLIFVKSAFDAGWNAVKPIVMAVWDFIKTTIDDDIKIIKGILAWFGQLGSLFHDWWGKAVDAVREQSNALLGLVGKIPGWINNALGGLPAMMFRAGVNVIMGLIHGIESMASSVGNAVAGIAKKVAGFFGLSPAVEGPLSGAGAPEIRGQHFAADIARGMTSGQGAIAAAASRLASSAAIGPGGGYGAGAAASGPATVQLQVQGGSGLDQLFMTWLRQQIRVKGGNVQTVLGH